MLGFVVSEQEKGRKYRSNSRVYAKDWFLQNSHVSLLSNLKENNPEDFQNYLWMTQQSFEMLLSLVQPHITKQDSCMRKAISTGEHRPVAKNYGFWQQDNLLKT